MRHDHKNRRSFLQGAGGVLLAIPYLSSLMGRNAFAMPQSPKLSRFVALYWPYGSFAQTFYPPASADSLATERASYKETLLSALGTIAPAFNQADFAAIQHKSLILRGLDRLSYYNHYPSAFLCGIPHVGPNSGASPYTESIDQIMARKIYSAPPPLPFLALGQQGSTPISFAHSAGTTLPLPYLNDAGVAYDFVTARILSGTSAADVATLRSRKQSIIDLVKADFDDVLSTTSKLSASDRARLENHLQVIRDLEVKFQSIQYPSYATPSKTSLTTPATTAAEKIERMLDVLALALNAGVTRIGTIKLFSGSGSGVPITDHHGLSHATRDSTALANQKTTMNLMIGMASRFAAKLEAVQDATGGTVLDNSLVFLGSDMGSNNNHNESDFPAVIFGGGKVLRNGLLLDYRSNVPVPFCTVGNLGRPYNELQISLMLAMGLSPSDWEVNGTSGWGGYKPNSYWTNYYSSSFAWGDKRSALPGIMA